MRRLKDVILAALLAAFLVGPSPATATDADADLREALRAQAEIIQQLRDELDLVREDQRRSEDRVLALEGQGVNGPTSGVDAAFVDRRIEQFDTSDDSRITLSGYATTQLMDPEGGPSTFGIQFNPIFHFRLTDRLHFNAELEIELERGEGEDDHGVGTRTEIDMEFATIDYLATDWLTVTAGQFLLPFNVFGTRLHPQWINKLASMPPIYRGHHGDAGIIPVLNDVGIMASGGAPLWNEESKFNYAMYLTNGWGRMIHDEEEEEEEGAEDGLDFIFGTTPDVNNEKAIGGRIGFLPIPNLEMGGSYQTSRANGPDGRYHLFGMDALYWHDGLELRGESIWLSRDDRDEGDLDKWGYYLQAAYRLKYLPTNGETLSGFLGRLEPVARWGQVLDAGPSNRRQLAFGLNYWLFDSVPLKFTYEINWGAEPNNQLFIQASYGF